MIKKLQTGKHASTKRALMAMAAVLCAGLALAPAAQAHPYLYFGPVDDAGNTLENTPPEGFTPWANLYEVADNFDAYLGAMMTPKVDPHAGCDLWVSDTCADGANVPIWTTVKGQQGPSWIGTNNGTDGAPNWNYTGAGSNDDVRLQMLDKLLDPAFTCYNGVAQDRIDAVRSAFAANVTKTLDNEITLYNVRLRATATIIGVTATADSTQTITTGGQTAPIPFKIFGSTAYTVTPQDIPNLWKTRKSLLRSANEYIRDAGVNMAAAYMTMGDPQVTNYEYALMGTMGVTAINQMLPSLLAGLGKSDGDKLTAPDLGTAIKLALGVAMSKVTLDSQAKAAVACGPWGTINDLDISITVTVDILGDVPIRITTSGQNLCDSITNFANKFSLANGYTSAAQYLATDGLGDLNGDGTTNLASYTAAGGNLAGYLANEGIACAATVPVPDLAGLTADAANTALAQAGLVAGTASQECSDSVAAGKVIRQDPAAATLVAPASAVSYAVSSGPCTPITGSVLINGNRSATNNRNVTLALTWGGGAGIGVVRMRFSDNGANWTAWAPLAATLPYTLPEGPDGHRTVRVQFLDKLNNKSAVFIDYIRLDTAPPTGTIIINQGALSTKTREVTLNLTWADTGALVSRMRFSDDGAHWTIWEPPTATRAYTLPEGLGYHTVRVQYRDGADNVSIAYNDYIKLIP